MPRRFARLHPVRRFRPVQQRFGMHSHAGIFAEYGQVFPEIELIAQFVNRSMPLSNLVNC